MNSLHVLLMIVLRYMNSLEQILKEPQENMEQVCTFSAHVF